ncbi:hypothetical protein VSR82_31840 [Burkholderia sp. JPY481]|uniref:hypothetical protein n=1 Tax=Paraburkholderia sp. JPY465 TaxID=3042285 RepID=UPI00317A65A6
MNIVTSIGVGTWVFHPPCHACGAPFVASGAWIASHAAFLAGSQRVVGRPAMACAVADGAYLMPRADRHRHVRGLRHMDSRHRLEQHGRLDGLEAAGECPWNLHVSEALDSYTRAAASTLFRAARRSEVTSRPTAGGKKC